MLLNRIHWLIVLGLAWQCRPPAQHEGIFRYNEDAAIATLDPAFAKDQSTTWATTQLFDGLVQMDSNLTVKPAIARSWELNGDGSVYVFHLRTDVSFHADACFAPEKTRNVTAGDIVYSFQRLTDPKTASPGAWIFHGKLDTAQLPFEALNDSTFVLRLNKPFPPMLGMLAMPYCSVVPKEAVTYYGNQFRSHPVGTGAFKLHTWKEGVVLALERNPHYFEKDENGQSLPYLKGIQISFIQGKQGAFLEFLQGRLDFFNGLESSFKDELLEPNGKLRSAYRDRFMMRVGPYLNTEYLGFQTDAHLPNAITNVQVRRAVSLAIDRQSLVHFLRNNIGIPATGGIVPVGLAGHIEGTDPYQPDSARKLLKVAGYGPMNPLHLSIATTPNYADLALFIQHQLEAVGIVVDIQTNPGSTQRKMISDGRLSFFRASWIADYPDAENYLSLFLSGNAAPNGPNYTRYANPTFDALFNRALNEKSDSLRYSLYAQMDQLVLGDAPVVVLFYDQSIRLIRPEIQGLAGNPLNIPVLKYVKKLQ